MHYRPYPDAYLRPVGLDDLKQALRHLHHAKVLRIVQDQPDAAWKEGETAFTLLHDVLVANGVAIDFLDPWEGDPVEAERERIVAEIESGFGALLP